MNSPAFPAPAADAESRLRALLSMATEWYWEQDAEFRFTYFSERGMTRGVVPPERILGRRRWEVEGMELVGSDWAAHRALHERHEPYSGLEVRTRQPDGSYRHMLVSGAPRFDAAGRFLGYHGVAQDVTALRQAQAALRESEARYRRLVEVSPEALFISREGRIAFANPAAVGLFGARDERELVGRATLDLVHPDSLDAVRARMRAFAAGAQTQPRMEQTYLRLNGAAVDVEVMSASLVHEGRPAVLSVARDIGRRKRVEAELRAAQQRVRVALEASSASVWETDVASGEVILSEGWSTLLGGAAAETRTTVQALAAITHAEDLARVAAASVRVKKGESPGFAEEHRVRRHDGGWIWVRTIGRVTERGDDGRALRMAGTIYDITREKREESLLALEHDVNRALATVADAAAGIQATLGAVCRSQDWQGGRYFRADEAAGLLRVEESWERGKAGAIFGADARNLTFARGVGLAGRVWESGEPIWVPDVRRDERVANKALAEKAGIRSAFVFPALAEGRTIGVLATFSREVREPDTRLLAAVRVIGSQLGQFLLRKQAEERLAHLAQFDATTGLPNRTLLHDRLEQAIAQARRNDWMIGLLYLDLDQFKWVNDTFGHGGGDALLGAVGQRLHACLRSGDTVARLGGDEFAVLLPDLPGAEAAGVVAEKILEALEAPFRLGAREAHVSASIGIAVYPPDAADAETLLRNADAAMYSAKEAGRNGYRFFTPAMNADAARRHALQVDLRRALERREFELHYQPQASACGRRIVGAEALLRWRRAGGTLVPPAEFVPVLEDTGLIAEVGDWVIAEACRQLMAWNGRAQRLDVAVNVSVRQFRAGALLASVERALAATGCDPTRLQIEITESMLMRDVEDTIKTLHALRARGVRVALDDFGTGYSSLAYLKRLPVDVIKIDRSFVRDVTADTNDAAIAEAIVSVAHSLGRRVVAEGVETEAQRAFLESIGCDEIQGYLLSRALPAPELLRWLEERR